MEMEILTCFTFKVYDGTSYSASTYTMTINATAVNDAPTGGNDAVTVSEDVETAFSTSDFTYSDADSDAFAGIKIITVETAGDLEYNGSDVSANDVISDVTNEFHHGF